MSDLTKDDRIKAIHKLGPIKGVAIFNKNVAGDKRLVLQGDKMSFGGDYDDIRPLIVLELTRDSVAYLRPNYVRMAEEETP